MKIFFEGRALISSPVWRFSGMGNRYFPMKGNDTDQQAEEEALNEYYLSYSRE